MTGHSPLPTQTDVVRPVQRRLLIPLTIVLLLLVGGFDTLLIRLYHEDHDQASKLLLEGAAAELNEHLVEQVGSLKAIEKALLRDKALATTLESQDRDALLRDYAPLFSQLRAEHGITHFYFHLPDRVNLLRVHQPTRHGDIIERFTLREAERTHKPASGIELGPMGTFTLRVVMPVFDDRTLVGYLELGEEIEDLLSAVREARGIELAVTIHKTLLTRDAWETSMKTLGQGGDWNQFPDDVVIYSSMSHFPKTAWCFVCGDTRPMDKLTDLEINGKPWHGLVTPLADAAGAEVGALIAFTDVSEETAQFNRMMILSSSVALCLAFVLVVFLYLALRRVDRGITESNEKLILAKNAAESHADELAIQNAAMDEHALVSITDSSGKIIYANDNFCRISQYSRDELIGQNHRMINSGLHPRAFFTKMWKTITAGKVWHGEIRNRAKDGSLYWADVTIVPYKGEAGLISRFFATRLDITERKRVKKQNERYTKELEGQKLEMQAQHEEIVAINATLQEACERADCATRVKSEFLANMSHEIRTPMTAILGFTENMLDADQSESDRLDCIHIIRRNGEYLIGLINDILDLSKIEAGKMTVERRVCQPCRIVADVASLMRVRADGKGLPLNIEYIGAIPETIQSDPLRLRQILINLVGNAIKFTEVGSIRLVTRFVEHDKASSLQFDVIDTGLGMTREQAAKLFQPFMQADNSTTRKFGGTGLGLTISKRFAELLGGDITIVETELGVGSTFRVTVATGPLEGVKMIEDPLSATVVVDSPNAVAQASRSDLHGVRILLAEDNATNQVLVVGILKKAGAEVTAVKDGKLALDAALAARDEGNPFDTILMDIQMPLMGGDEATKLLREKGYTKTVIALTAHAMEGDREKYLEVGFNDYATKPINRKKLIATIQRHLVPVETASAAAT